MSEISSKRQVAKNAIMLYIRMIFTMFVGLYSSRVVLQTLGITDYGVYNVVAAVVPFFGFFSNSMAENNGLLFYLVQQEGKEDRVVSEMELAHRISFCRPQERLFSAQIDRNEHFVLRYHALQYQKAQFQSPLQRLSGAQVPRAKSFL